jgi:DNA repair protein RadC
MTWKYVATKAAADALGISIHDHLGRKGHASFRSLGLLT